MNPHKEADQGDDGKRLGPALFKEQDQIRPPEIGPSSKKLDEGNKGLSHKSSHLNRGLSEPDGLCADSGQQGFPFRLFSRALSLWNSRGQLQEAPCPFR